MSQAPYARSKSEQPLDVLVMILVLGILQPNQVANEVQPRCGSETQAGARHLDRRYQDVRFFHVECPRSVDVSADLQRRRNAVVAGRHPWALDGSGTLDRGRRTGLRE